MASRISPVHPSVDRVLIVNNPRAGSRRRDDSVRDLVACLRGQGMRPEVVTDPAAIASMAGQYQARGQLRAVVAAGGDGTLTEIANRTEPGVPLTVFPLGTANLLAGYLGIGSDPQAMAQMLCQGSLVRLDAARANGRIFLLMAGCGFDADVVHRLHRQRSGRHISYWTWARPILESIRRYRFPDLRVYCDTAADTPAGPMRSARWAFVVNLPVYAGGLRVAPEAVGTDGMLNVCTFAGGSFWHGLRYVGCVLVGRQRSLSDYKSALALRVRIESDEPVPYQLDGDPGGVLPLEIDVLPARLTLWAPRAQALALGLPGVTGNQKGV
ncbi:MAG: diacylglycerol kinase family protein [Pirellulales bacterium]